MQKNNPGFCGWLAGFCGRHPMFAAAVVAASCVAAAACGTGVGLLTGAAFCVAASICGGWRRGLALLLCGWLATACFAWRDGIRRTAEAEMSRVHGGSLRGVVLRDAQGEERFWSAPVEVTEGRHDGAIVWWQGRGEVPVAGSLVAANGNFGPLPEPRNPGEFNRAAWLRSQGVSAVFHAAHLGGTMETGRWAAMGAKIRHGFRDRVTAGLAAESQEAEVIRAIVIGETPPDADVLIAAFRNSGTLHAFSVSGMHVAMVGSIGWLLLAWAGVPRRKAVLILLPLIFGYSWITGNSAPAVRSAWMAAVFLGAFVFRRKPDLLNALGAVLLVAMLWDGRLLFQPGVQLSYGVVAAIAVGTAWASKAFAWLAVPELHMPTRLMSRWQTFWLGLRRNVAQSLGVSLAAGVGSAPLTAWHFGLITPVSVIAGLFLTIPIFILLSAALLSAALSPLLPEASRGVNFANGKVADVCVWLAEGFSAIPGGHFQVWRETRPMLLVYDLDHGSGATCFTAGPKGAVLMDCGDAKDFKRIVAPSLRKLGIEPDSVVLSHPDGGHLGGGSPVWQAFPIRQALLPVKLARSPALRSWVEDGPKAGVLTKIAAASGSLAFPDGATLEILHAPDPLAYNALADDRVAIYRLHWHGWKILFTSDAGMGTEMKLLDFHKDLAADVIIAGRHRTDFSLCDRFLDAVHPQAIIASNSPYPVEEILPPASVAYWESRGIHVIDQARSGGVTLRVDEAGNLRLEGFLGGAPLLLKPH